MEGHLASNQENLAGSIPVTRSLARVAQPG